MTAVLGFDTATPDTVVALLAGDAPPRELRHTPAPGERPGHASRLLPLAGEHEGPVLAVLDARRGEAFAAAWRDGERLLAPVAVPPDALGELVGGLSDNSGPWLAVGDGAVRFRGLLEPAAVTVPADGSPFHCVSAIAICRLARASAPVARDALVPEYVRLPDAEEALRRQHR